MTIPEWQSTLQELRHDLRIANEQINALEQENESLKGENAILSSAVDRLGREKIKEYIETTQGSFRADRDLINAERVGLYAGNVTLYGTSFGIAALVELIVGDTATGSRFRTLGEKMGPVRANMVALEILRKHYESNFTHVKEIADDLFLLYFHAPQDLVKNGDRASFREPSSKYKDLDVLMSTRAGPDIDWEEFRDVPLSKYEERNAKSTSRIEKAHEALRLHHERILDIIRLSPVNPA